jgi:hypothetical protein
VTTPEINHEGCRLSKAWTLWNMILSAANETFFFQIETLGDSTSCKMYDRHLGRQTHGFHSPASMRRHNVAIDEADGTCHGFSSGKSRSTILRLEAISQGLFADKNMI